MKSSQMRQPRRHISPALGTAVAVWGGRGGHGPEQPHPRVPSPSPNCPISPHPHVPSVPMPPPMSTPQPSMSPTSPLTPMFPHNPLWTHCPPHTPHCPPPPLSLTRAPHSRCHPRSVQGGPGAGGAHWGAGGWAPARHPPPAPGPPTSIPPPGPRRRRPAPQHRAPDPSGTGRPALSGGGSGVGVSRGGGGWGVRTPPGCRMGLQPEDPLQNESPKCKETSKCGHPPPPHSQNMGSTQNMETPPQNVGIPLLNVGRAQNTAIPPPPPPTECGVSPKHGDPAPKT